MITHYDLFAGIGGFSVALEEVFHDRQIKHIFCEWEQFPTAVLRKHWPEAEFWGDIADLVAHTKSAECQQPRPQPERQQAGRTDSDTQSWTIVTGGFPCQPFSHAGRRKGTADDRYQWPNMFEAIRNVRPEWVIAENVRGLVTWNEGMVLEQVCSDLESEGYEVQPLIIPAVAVNAPHRRDRVWIIGHAKHNGLNGSKDRQGTNARSNSDTSWPQELKQPSRPDIPRQTNARTFSDWQRDWQEVAFATCNDAMDDGIPRIVDGVPQSFAKWRQNSLKAYGNAIVPQVVVEIFKAIRIAQDTPNDQTTE